MHKSGEIQGNVSLERALEYFSEKKGPGSLQMVVEMRSGHDGSNGSSRYFTRKFTSCPREDNSSIVFLMIK